MTRKFCTRCGSELDVSSMCGNLACPTNGRGRDLAAAAQEMPPPAPNGEASAPGATPPREPVPFSGQRGWHAPEDHPVNLETVGKAAVHQLWRSFFLATVVYFVILFLLYATGGWHPFISLLFAVIPIVLALRRSVRMSVGEWNGVLDGQAFAADSAWAEVIASFTRRGTPVDIFPRRIKLPRPPLHPAAEARNYLAIHHGDYEGLVSVFPFGNDLYMGWTLWWSKQNWSLVISHFTTRGRVPDLRNGRTMEELLALDEMKAFREVLDHAVREGIEVAVEGREVSIAGTIGHDVAIEDLAAPVMPPLNPGTTA